MVEMREFDARPYQEAVAGTLYDTNENALVHMDMGLGKTETALMNIAAQHNRAATNSEDYSALVVLPNGQLVDQWETRISQYGLDDDGGLTVETNPRATDLQHRNTESPVYGRTRRERDAANELSAKMGRIKDWENQRVQQEKTRSLTEADITLTTFQQLHSDTGNGAGQKRFDYAALDGVYDEIIIDEASHVVRYAKHDDPDRWVDDGDFEFSAYFEDMYHTLQDSTRFIGLTGFPGERRDAVQTALDAELVRPSTTETHEYLPDVETITHTTDDTTLKQVYDHFQGEADELSMYIGSRLGADGNVTPQQLSTLVDSDDKQLAHWARRYWAVSSMSRRLEETLTPSLEAQQPAIVDRMNEHTASPELNALVEDIAGYRPAKEDGLLNLTGQILDYGQRPVVFTTHRDTAHAAEDVLSGVIGADVDAVTGETAETDRTDAFNAFNNGQTDALVMTYGIGGEGLDLDGADHAIHLRAPSEEQRYSATGRIRRGQTPQVFEHVLAYDFTDEAVRVNDDLWETGIDEDLVALDPSEEARTAMDAIQQ